MPATNFLRVGPPADLATPICIWLYTDPTLLARLKLDPAIEVLISLIVE